MAVFWFVFGLMLVKPTAIISHFSFDRINPSRSISRMTNPRFSFLFDASRISHVLLFWNAMRFLADFETTVWIWPFLPWTSSIVRGLVTSLWSIVSPAIQLKSVTRSCPTVTTNASAFDPPVITVSPSPSRKRARPDPPCWISRLSSIEILLVLALRSEVRSCCVGLIDPIHHHWGLSVVGVLVRGDFNRGSFIFYYSNPVWLVSLQKVWFLCSTFFSGSFLVGESALITDDSPHG